MPYGRDIFINQICQIICLCCFCRRIPLINRIHQSVEICLLYRRIPLIDRIERVLTVHTDLSGLWQVASEPINKYELLQLLRDKFHKPVEVIPYDGFSCDRSLAGARFSAATGYRAPTWPKMISELAESHFPS